MKLKKIGILIFISLIVSALSSSCKKFVQIKAPGNQLISSTVFTDDNTAIAAVSAIYRRMMLRGTSFADGDYSSISFLTGLSADELDSYATDPSIREYYQNAISASNQNNYNYFWTEAYAYIYQSNAAIEGMEASSAISPGLKNQLLGESKFIRAFCNFYLTNLYGDIPLILTTNYQANAIASRTGQDKVYMQIIADLLDAQNLLSTGYDYSAGEKVRPNKWTATALLARVYLYNSNWGAAETQASLVINSGQYRLPNLNEVFLKNSDEAIWQLMPVVTGVNTFEGANFILSAAPSGPSRNSAALSNVLNSAFEAGDLRYVNWIDSFTNAGITYYFPYKYKIKSGSSLTEYSMVFRLAEQFLIRSEARAQLNTDLAGAAADLDTIRTRAGLPVTSATSQLDLLPAIYHERQVELFTEWGHRWLDLKRLGLADAVLGVEKPGYWHPFASLYPIPQKERQNDPNLSQNTGY
jgi:hypothetical protein